MIRELEKDGKYKEWDWRNKSGNRPPSDFLDHAVDSHEQNSEPNVKHRRRTKAPVPKKNRTLRYDYKIPANDLSSEKVKKILKIYDISKPIHTDYECVTLSIRPNVPVCLYPNHKGKHLS